MPDRADPAPPTIGREQVREAALDGVRWVVLARGVVLMATLASSVVLARLIAPAEFGVAAIALVVAGLAPLLVQQGVAGALVQRRELTPEHVRTAVALGLVAGFAGAAVVAALSGLARDIFGPRSGELLLLATPAFVIAGVSAVPYALLQRRLAFRVLSHNEVVAAFAGIAVSVVLAIGGLGAEAIVLGAIARAAVALGGLVRAAPPPWPAWDRACARDVAGFGAPAVASSFGHQGFRNVDYMIVGAKLGMTDLGFYWRAYQMAFEYQSKVTGVMQRIAFPVFSRSRDLADMRRMRIRMVRLHAVLIFPLLFGFVAVAPDLIPWVYGEPWRPTVAPAQILAIAALGVPLTAGIGAVVLAAGRPRRLAVVDWCVAVTYAAVVWVAAGHGLLAVCWSVLAFQAVKFLVQHHFLSRKVAGITLRHVAAEAGAPLAAGAGLLAAAAVTAAALGDAGAVAPVRAAIALAAGGLIYLGVLHRWFPAAWADLELVGRRLLPRRPRLAGRPLRPAPKAS